MFRASKYDRHADGGFDFDNPDATWFVENEEIEKALAFLNEDVDHAAGTGWSTHFHPLATSSIC